MKFYKLTGIVLAILLASFAVPPKKKITVWMIGDSTMSIKDPKTWPETGWGMPFVTFWDSTVTIDNRAKNGRSTKSFRAEGLWQPVQEQLQEGDYVFIQFGHNDEVPTKASATTETEFKENLVRYVTESRNKKAVPVLLTPVARRKFDANGKIEGTHDVYAVIVRVVAKENNVPLIDVDKDSQALLQQLGAEPSKLLFNHLAPGEHPNYPVGREDNTHFSELGARRMAELVLRSIRDLRLELAERIIVRSS